MPRELTPSASGAASAPADPVRLTSTEAARRLTEVGPNELPTPAPPTLPKCVVRQLAEPLSLLLLGAALLTGESEPAEKSIGSGHDRSRSDGTRASTAFAGTLVVRGRAAGVVHGTGSHTEVGAIAAALGHPSIRRSWPSSAPSPCA